MWPWNNCPDVPSALMFHSVPYVHCNNRPCMTPTRSNAHAHARMRPPACCSLTHRSHADDSGAAALSHRWPLAHADHTVGSSAVGRHHHHLHHHCCSSFRVTGVRQRLHRKTRAHASALRQVVSRVQGQCPASHQQKHQQQHRCHHHHHHPCCTSLESWRSCCLQPRHQCCCSVPPRVVPGRAQGQRHTAAPHHLHHQPGLPPPAASAGCDRSAPAPCQGCHDWVVVVVEQVLLLLHTLATAAAAAGLWWWSWWQWWLQ